MVAISADSIWGWASHLAFLVLELFYSFFLSVASSDDMLLSLLDVMAVKITLNKICDNVWRDIRLQQI